MASKLILKLSRLNVREIVTISQTRDNREVFDETNQRIRVDTDWAYRTLTLTTAICKQDKRRSVAESLVKTRRSARKF